MSAILAEATRTGSAIFSMVFVLIFLVLGVAILVWWVMALVHLIKNEDVPNRIVWIVLLFVVGGIIGPIYLLAVKKPYEAAKAGNGGATPPAPNNTTDNPTPPADPTPPEPKNPVQG